MSKFKCKNCGSVMEEDELKCKKCGKTTPTHRMTRDLKKCPICHTPIEEGDEWCKGCGLLCFGVC